MRLELFGEPVRHGRLALYLVIVAGLVTASFLLLPPGLVRLSILGLVALPFIFALLDRPRWVFYIFVIVLFSNIDIFISFRFFRYLLLFQLAALALAVLNGRRIVVHDRLFVILVGAFLIIAVQSLSIARDLGRGLYSLNLFVKVLINLAIVTQFVRDRRELNAFFLAVTAGMAINNFLPIVLDPPTEYSSFSLIWNQGVFRYEGFALEPNAFASLQIFFIPIVLYLIAVYRKPGVARLAFLALLAATIFMMTLTFSRSGFVSVAFLLVVLLVVERRNRTVLTAGLAVIAAAVILAPGVYWDRIATLAGGDAAAAQDLAIVSRLETMRVALKLGLAHPVLGVGMENFIYGASFHIPYMNVVHNAVLQIFSELGFAGLGVFAAIICYNLRIISSLMGRRDDPEAAQLGRILMVHQLAVLVNSLFLPISYQVVLWFTLALPSIARYAFNR